MIRHIAVGLHTDPVAATGAYGHLLERHTVQLTVVEDFESFDQAEHVRDAIVLHGSLARLQEWTAPEERPARLRWELLEIDEDAPPPPPPRTRRRRTTR